MLLPLDRRRGCLGHGERAGRQLAELRSLERETAPGARVAQIEHLVEDLRELLGREALHGNQDEQRAEGGAANGLVVEPLELIRIRQAERVASPQDLERLVAA